MSVLPFSPSGNFLFSHPNPPPPTTYLFSLQLSLILSSLRWQAEGGGSARRTPGSFSVHKKEREDEKIRGTSRQKRKWEIVLEIVLWICGLLILVSPHKSVWVLAYFCAWFIVLDWYLHHLCVLYLACFSNIRVICHLVGLYYPQCSEVDWKHVNPQRFMCNLYGNRLKGFIWILLMV